MCGKNLENNVGRGKRDKKKPRKNGSLPVKNSETQKEKRKSIGLSGRSLEKSTAGWERGRDIKAESRVRGIRQQGYILRTKEKKKGAG